MKSTLTFQQRQQQTQIAQAFGRIAAALARPGGSQDVERLRGTLGPIFATPSPLLAQALPEAANFILGPVTPDMTPQERARRAITIDDAILWSRWRDAMALFEHGDFARLVDYCNGGGGEGARAFCDTPGLGWVQAYARLFSPDILLFFEPEGSDTNESPMSPEKGQEEQEAEEGQEGAGGLTDTLTNVLNWHYTQEQHKRRALYGLIVANAVWRYRANYAARVRGAAQAQTPALVLLDAPIEQLQGVVNGLLGSRDAFDPIPVGRSAPLPEGVRPIPVADAPIRQWTRESVADESAFASLPGGINNIFDLAKNAVAQGEQEGITQAAQRQTQSAAEARRMLSEDRITQEEADREIQDAVRIEQLRQEAQRAVAAHEPDALIDIGTAFPGTGVYMIGVHVGNTIVPAIGIVPSAERARAATACVQCNVRIGQGLPPIVGTHRH